MNTLTIILLALIPVLLAASALCSAAETALFSLTQADKIRLRRNHPSVFEATSTLLRDPGSLLVAILLLNVTVNTCYFTVTGLVLKRVTDGVWVGVGGLASVLLIILLGEVLPKGVAAIHRVLLCKLMAVPVLAWFQLITPARIILARFVIAPLTRLLRPQNSPPSRLTTDELSSLIEVAARQGVLHEGEEQLLADVVQLSTLRVKEIMTPRVDIRWLSATDTSQELLQVARETGWTRFPVSRAGTLTERSLAGIVNADRVLPQLARQGAAARLPLPALLEQPQFVPERARVDQLLEFFRTAKVDVAMVVNELGELTGMVQIDDVIDELVKFAASPDQAGAQHEQVQMIGFGEWEVPGRLSVRDWEEFFDPRHAERTRGRVSTVAGLILARLGRLPRAGDGVDIGSVRLRVEAMRGRMIERVRVSLRTETGAGIAGAQAGGAP